MNQEIIVLKRVVCPGCKGTSSVRIPRCHLDNGNFWCESGYCNCGTVSVPCSCDKGYQMVREGTDEVWKRA